MRCVTQAGLPIFQSLSLFSAAVGLGDLGTESPGQGTMLADSRRCPNEQDLQIGSENCFVAPVQTVRNNISMEVKICQRCEVFLFL